VLADEPTGNLDSERSADILGLLSRFNREHGQTFVLVTHDPEVAAACHRVIHMRDGVIQESVINGTHRPVRAEPTPSPQPELVGVGAG
jgi:ABC-type lipoprotein export system ATPase subunit